MGKFLTSAIIIAILSGWCFSAFSQSGTSKGTEFWTAFMANTNPPGTNEGSEMLLYVTSDVNTTGQVQIADGSFSQSFSVTANKITTISVPGNAYLGQQGIFTRGIHITTQLPVAVYAHIFAQYSSGATLLLPVTTLGKDYYSINYTQKSNSSTSSSIFMVIATEDNTTVMITPSVQLLDGSKANIAFPVKLNKGQVYQAMADSDLTGSQISSVSAGTNTCTKVAVFAGSSRVYIGCTPLDTKGELINSSSDNLFQQVYPTAAWGKSYITVPLKKRDYDVFRIILSMPNTNVTLNGVAVNASQFKNGIYYQFSSNTTNVIYADQPIQVAQYAVTQGDNLNCTVDNADIGDPEMIYLTPLEQTINNVTLFSASHYQILQSYLNIIIKTAATTSAMLDGKNYNVFKPVPGASGYSYAQIPVDSGAHTLSAGTGFNAIAYGFGQRESYGYAAGTNLQNLNSFLSLQQPGSISYQLNGCTGALYNLLLTLPYIPTTITWDLENGSQSITVPGKPSQTTTKDNQVLYLFTYPGKPVAYPAGNYKAMVTTIKPNTDICDQTEQYNLEYKISDPPTADFSYNGPCSGDATLFNDNSKITANVSSWLWDFGDGQTSNQQNPTHIYPKAGDYKVGLTITDIDGCSSTKFLTVTIFPTPTAAFTPSAPAYAGEDVLFTDNSTIEAGIINQWAWDFGDGQTSALKNPVHQYATPGTYNISLNVISDKGCSNAVISSPITIYPVPKVDFTLPDICINDAYAQFTNKSTIADNSEAYFSYLWDFGDPNNTSSPNTSTDENAKHSYKSTGTYNVTLTVKSRFGCSVSKTYPLTVNGSNPRAGFIVENANNLCSSNEVIFDDVSSPPGFGNITKIVWYYDYNNNPNVSETFLKADMPANRKYNHNYETFNTLTSRNYAVEMVVYSGEICSDIYGPFNITINPNPVVSLEQVGSICQGANPIQIKVDAGQFTGKSVFSGPGVSPGGLFNPAISGPGVSTVNCTFTVPDGCDYTTSEQINVIPDPTVSIAPVINLLEGNSVILDATAKGNNLKYKWSPSTGLDHDDILTPYTSVTDDINYTLTVTSSDNCTSQTNVAVKVFKSIIIPNTFTPNGDGINDTWQVKYLYQYPDCIVDIFNRYGQKVFTSIGYAVEWDGKYKGANLPSGVYYYIINPRHGRKPVSGSVSIIR